MINKPTLIWSTVLSEPAKAIEIYVDADACPVKSEIYRVAERYAIRVYVVSNSPMAIPRTLLIERIVVGSNPDAADDWIAERVSRGDIVITADVPLQHRCIKAGADVITPTGRALTVPAARPIPIPVRPRSRHRPAETRRVWCLIAFAGKFKPWLVPFPGPLLGYTRHRRMFGYLGYSVHREKHAATVTADPEPPFWAALKPDLTSAKATTHTLKRPPSSNPLCLESDDVKPHAVKRRTPGKFRSCFSGNQPSGSG